jgi:hypothetical protein
MAPIYILPQFKRHPRCTSGVIRPWHLGVTNLWHYRSSILMETVQRSADVCNTAVATDTKAVGQLAAL